MAKGAKKGEVRNPKGRGNSPNKVTAQAREAIALFVDGNAYRLAEWLDRIAEESPKDAFNCFQSVIEYHIPKLARTDTTTLTLPSEKLTKEQRDAIFNSFKA